MWRPAKASATPMRCCVAFQAPHPCFPEPPIPARGPAFRKLCQGLRFPKFQGCSEVNAPKVPNNLHLQKLCRPHPVLQSKRFTCGGWPRPPLPLCAAQILFFSSSESPQLETALCGSVTRSEQQTWRRKRIRTPPLARGFSGVGTLNPK